MFYAVAKQVACQRYYVVTLLLKSHDDFLKGAVYLSDLDGEKLNETIKTSAPKLYRKKELEE